MINIVEEFKDSSKVSTQKFINQILHGTSTKKSYVVIDRSETYWDSESHLIDEFIRKLYRYEIKEIEEGKILKVKTNVPSSSSYHKIYLDYLDRKIYYSSYDNCVLTKFSVNCTGEEFNLIFKDILLNNLI